MKVLKVIVTKSYTDEFGENQTKKAVFTASEWDKAQKIVSDSRWGNTQYMSSIEDETCARLIGGSVCNNSYTCKPIYSFK
jgi:hypothetical protein